MEDEEVAYGSNEDAKKENKDEFLEELQIVMDGVGKSNDSWE